MQFLAVILLLADMVATRSVIHTGEIMRVSAEGVQIKVAIGEITIPKADIVKVEAAKPAAFDTASAAFKAGKFQDAVAGFRSVAERYAGLNTPWAEESLVKLGEACIGVKNYAEAKKAFDSFKTLYPKSPLAAGMDVKYARVLLEQKDTGKAAESLQSFLAPMLKKDFLSDEQELAVAEALVLLGDCQAADGKPQDALDHYLKVVALYDLDAERAAEAKYKAGKVFEQIGNWKRAKDSYEELLKDSPSFAHADDVKKRLAAHPE